MITINLLPHKPTDEERFWAKVQKSDGCWTWLGNKDRDGYGNFSIKRKGLRAHRYALMISGINVPDGMLVCHHCDNPSCVRPEHLYVGTVKDNSRDAVERGRTPRGMRSGRYTKPEATARGDRHGLRVHPESRQHGDKNYCAKLDWAKAAIIRNSDKTCKQLAEEFEVSAGLIGHIRSGRKWKQEWDPTNK